MQLAGPIPEAVSGSAAPSPAAKPGDDAAAASRPVDPVCGTYVNEQEARAKGLVSSYGGRSYFFWTSACKEQFDAEPAKFAKKE